MICLPDFITGYEPPLISLSAVCRSVLKFSTGDSIPEKTTQSGYPAKTAKMEKNLFEQELWSSNEKIQRIQQW